MRGGGWGGGGGMNGGSRGRGDGGGSWRGGGGGGGSWRGGGGGGGGGKAYFGSRGGRSSGRRGGYRGRGGRGGADGGAGRGGPSGGSDLPTQCLPGLEGQCHRGASCWYVHAVSYATNSVEPSAHQGAVVSLANDSKNLYSFGVDGVVRTFEWSPQAGFTSTKKQAILGVGTMFAVSEPTKQMYMMGTSCPILPGLSHEASCSVGRVQVHYGSTAMDLSISPEERPYTDGVKVTQAVAFENPDAGTGQPNPIIFTAGGDGVIRRWQFDQASNRFAVVATLEGHTREITGLVLHTDQQAMLFSSSLDGTVRGWSATANTLEWIATGLGTYRRFTEAPMTEGSMGPGHQEGVTSIVKLAYEGAYYLATTGSDGSLRMWNLQGQCLGAGPSVDFRTGPALTLEQVVFNDNSSVLVVAYQNGVIIWTIPTLEVYVVIGGTSPGPQGPPRNHVTALLSPAPGIYVTGSSDGAVKVWNVAPPTDT